MYNTLTPWIAGPAVLLFAFLVGCSGSGIQLQGIKDSSVAGSLPALPWNQRAGLVASVDATGHNDDGFTGFYYPYREGGEIVLFDETGPGELIRAQKAFWSTLLPHMPAERYPVRFFVDDSPDPSYELDVQTIFEGQDPFSRTLTNKGVGGYVAYGSIPFRSRLKITAPCVMMAGNYPMPSQHYQFTWSRGTQRNDVRVWERIATLRGACPHGPTDWSPWFPVGPLGPGASTNAMLLTGSGTVLGLRFVVEDPADWRDLWIELHWDGATVPAVKLPLGFLVGASDPPYPVQSAMFGMDGQNQGWCYFPMPFRSSASVRLLNRSTRVRRPQVAAIVNGTTPPEPFGLFHAAYREAVPTTMGQDHEVLSVTGWGKYVGTILEAESLKSWQSTYTWWELASYLEGDERIYVDSSQSPIHGSASEVYFNWGWYDHLPVDQRFSLPFHGYSGLVVEFPPDDVALKRSLHRLHMMDPVPFYRDLRFMLEHGAINDAFVHYRTAAFYYLHATPALSHCDTLDVGDLDDESAHGYSRPDATRILLTSRTWGDSTIPLTSDTGREIVIGSSVGFTASVPEDNEGLLLRCRVDQEEGPCQAMVIIDGSPAGVWYRASSVGDGSGPPFDPHRRWLDHDFEVPAHLTAGKTWVRIEVVPLGPGAWREFRYDVFAYHRPRTS
jgi:hypothetical protein